MKTAAIPQIRIEAALRTSLEEVLDEGETISAFVEASVRKAIENRQALRSFDARCDAALKHFLSTGESYSSAEVLDEMRERTQARRARLAEQTAK